MSALSVADPVLADAAAAAADLLPSTQYLTFRVGGEMFAIGILAVKEIIEHHGLTSVPMMPACVRGVINLRGAVVPVLDLATRFGRPSAEVTKRTCIIIVEVRGDADHQDVGIVVDAVYEVLDIAAGDIEPPPSFGARVRSDFIQGMGKVRGKFVILLDTRQVLSLDELTPAGGNGAAAVAPSAASEVSAAS